MFSLLLSTWIRGRVGHTIKTLLLLKFSLLVYAPRFIPKSYRVLGRCMAQMILVTAFNPESSFPFLFAFVLGYGLT